MHAIDVEALLRPVSAESLAGENLEYDLNRALITKALSAPRESMVGAKAVATTPPDWTSVRDLAIEIAKRTKDLRVAIDLSHVALADGSLADFRDALRLTLGYLQEYWEPVYPQLDPSDDNDTRERTNTLRWLCDEGPQLLDRVPLLPDGASGPISFRVLAIAKGQRDPSNGEVVADPDQVKAAFQQCDVELLKTKQELVRDAGEALKQIDGVLQERLGSADSISFEPLARRLAEIQAALQEILDQRAGVVASDGVVALNGNTAVDLSSPKRGVAIPTSIQTRDDAIRAMEAVSIYYKAHEPSSPIPLLLDRARRIASKSFIEIIGDLTPEAMSSVRALLMGEAEGETSQSEGQA